MKNNEKQRLRKREILGYILPLMDEDGIENIKVKDICAAANISVGSFYHYFESKEAIYHELFALMDDYFESRKDEICDGNNTLTMLERFANCYYENAMTWGYYCNRAILISSLQKSSIIYHSNRRPFYRILHEIIEQGIEIGQIRDDMSVEEIEKMILILLRGYLLAWANGDPTRTSDELFQKQVELFVASLYAEV